MTDYRQLSQRHKDNIDREINENIEPKHHKNPHNGFEWDEPSYTLQQVHSGNYCAECLMIYYNCLCSHQD